MKNLDRVFIALGSNISPRGKRLEEARKMLRKIACGGWKESSIYETPPIGPPGQGPYFNQVVSFWCTFGPGRLLHYLKGTELLLGRRARGLWHEREIDLDLLYCGNEISSGIPVLPHQRISERQFVLIPLCEIEPTWVDPLCGIPVKEMLSQLQRREGRAEFRMVSQEEIE